MKINDVYTAFVSWHGGGKYRPILILKEDLNNIYFYRITTKYKNKSRAMQAIRYPIVDWRQTGLHQASYVVIDRPYQMKKRIMSFKYVGHLTIKDIKGLKNFIIDKQSNKKHNTKI